MNNPSRTPPRWARQRAATASRSEFPDIGIEPPHVPKLPTRLLPFKDPHTISAMTLTDVVATTQRILNCISYEVVYGPSSDVIDLRSADDSVIQLAKMNVQPFEEGSFVIPGTLTEEPISIEGRSFSGTNVLARFLDVMESIGRGSGAVPASISILQAVEELGRITRREANIEYSPQLPLKSRSHTSIVLVDNRFVSMVASIRKQRTDPQSRLDSVEGVLTALDLNRGTLRLTLSDKSVVRGTFGDFARPLLIKSVSQKVRLSGTVTLERKRPTFVNVMLAETID